MINSSDLERVHIGAHNVGKIMVSSGFLQMQELAYECIKYLNSRIRINNCIILFNFADHYNSTEVLKNTFDYILQNIWQLIEDENYLVMTTKLMRQIMQKPFLNIPSEEYLMSKFIQWVKYDLENRASDAIELLKLIKLPLIRRKVSKLFLKFLISSISQLFLLFFKIFIGKRY